MAHRRLGSVILRKLDSIEISYDGDSWDVLHERIKGVTSINKFSSWHKISFLSNVIGALAGTFAIGLQVFHTQHMEDLTKEVTHSGEQLSISDFVPAQSQLTLEVEQKNVTQAERAISVENRNGISQVTPDRDPTLPKSFMFIDASDEELMFQTPKRSSPEIDEVPVELPDVLTTLPIDSGLTKSGFMISAGITMIQPREIGVKPFWGMTARSYFHRPRTFAHFIQTDFYSGKFAFSSVELSNSPVGSQIRTRQEVSKEISFQSIRIGVGMDYLIKSNNRFGLDISAGASADMIISQNVEINTQSFHSDDTQKPFETLSTLKTSEVDPYFIPGISSSLGIHFGQLIGRVGATVPLSKLKESEQLLVLWETRLMLRLN